MNEVLRDQYVDDCQRAVDILGAACARAALLLAIDKHLQARVHLAEAVELALARREQDGLVVIPVLLRPASLLDSPFADLKPLPGDGRPISQWSDRDAALVDVVAGVRLHVL